MTQQFDPTSAESKLWGIPGTSKVPSPEKELKKLIDKGKKEFQREVNKVANKAKGDAQRTLNKANREISHGLHQVGDEIEDGIKKAAGEAEDAIKDAFYALAAQAVHIAVNDLGGRYPGQAVHRADLRQALVVPFLHRPGLQDRHAPTSCESPAEGQEADCCPDSFVGGRRRDRVPARGSVAGCVRRQDEGLEDRGCR